MTELSIPTPRWAKPLLAPSRYKGASGGRGSGKSWFFADCVVDALVCDPDIRIVCIREVQRSLRFSAKKLIEDQIERHRVGHLFEVLRDEIRPKNGNGVVIFNGMQDHTADSIKSLEGFSVAWVEEAQSLSARSLELLLPTIRKPQSELWFSWNPDQPTDPVDAFFKKEKGAAHVHVNYDQNPFCPDEIRTLAEQHRLRDPDTFGHVWLGEYNTKSDDQVLHGKWYVEDFEPGQDWEPYYGADWGFSVDPTTLVECYINNDMLYICREAYGNGVEIVDTPALFDSIQSASHYVIRADSARPELISYMQKNGYPKIKAVDKWKGSIEDGITHLRSFKKIIIHPECKMTAQEARLWKWKRDKAGEITPKLQDGNDHCWDAIRYALAPFIKKSNNFNDLLKMAVNNG